MARVTKDEIARSESQVFRSGMVPETWNLAVRVQAAVRDAIDWPTLTMDQAFEIAREVFRTYDFGDAAAEFRARLQAEADRVQAEKLSEQKRISQNAGKR